MAEFRYVLSGGGIVRSTPGAVGPEAIANVYCRAIIEAREGDPTPASEDGLIVAVEDVRL